MNENELLTPDYLFEVSWEVCNKVGGIHTVVSTEGLCTVESKLGDDCLLIGPDIQREGDNPELEEDGELLKAWRPRASTTTASASASAAGAASAVRDRGAGGPIRRSSRRRTTS